MGPIFIDEAKMITPRRKRKHILNLTAAFVNVNRKSHDLSAGDVEEAGMGTLSPARKQILDFIASFIDERGYDPAVRDIAQGCGISSASIAQCHLNVLEREGYIQRDREISRSICLAKRRVGVYFWSSAAPGSLYRRA